MFGLSFPLHSQQRIVIMRMSSHLLRQALRQTTQRSSRRTIRLQRIEWRRTIAMECMRPIAVLTSEAEENIPRCWELKLEDEDGT